MFDHWWKETAKWLRWQDCRIKMTKLTFKASIKNFAFANFCNICVNDSGRPTILNMALMCYIIWSLSFDQKVEWSTKTDWLFIPFGIVHRFIVFTFNVTINVVLYYYESHIGFKWNFWPGKNWHWMHNEWLTWAVSSQQQIHSQKIQQKKKKKKHLHKKRRTNVNGIAITMIFIRKLALYDAWCVHAWLWFIFRSSIVVIYGGFGVAIHIPNRCIIKGKKKYFLSTRNNMSI